MFVVYFFLVILHRIIYYFITNIIKKLLKMKKYLLIVTVFALGLSFAACQGKKTENATTTQEPVQQEVAATPSDSDALAKYETLINQAIDLQGKIANGDTASVQALAQVTQDLTSLATDLQNAATTFTPDQAQKFSDLAQKWAAAAAAATNAANTKAPVKK